MTTTTNSAAVAPTQGIGATGTAVIPAMLALAPVAQGTQPQHIARRVRVTGSTFAAVATGGQAASAWPVLCTTHNVLHMAHNRASSHVVARTPNAFCPGCAALLGASSPTATLASVCVATGNPVVGTQAAPHAAQALGTLAVAPAAMLLANVQAPGPAHAAALAAAMLAAKGEQPQPPVQAPVQDEQPPAVEQPPVHPALAAAAANAELLAASKNAAPAAAAAAKGNLAAAVLLAQAAAAPAGSKDRKTALGKLAAALAN